MLALLGNYRPDSLIPMAVGMLAAGLFIVVYWVVTSRTERDGVQKRLRIAPAGDLQKVVVKEVAKKSEAILSEKTLKKAQEFYAKGDPENVARLRARLIQAGYMDPKAPGYFFVARIGLLVFCFLAIFGFVNIHYSDMAAMQRWTLIAVVSGIGYFAPNILSFSDLKSYSEYALDVEFEVVRAAAVYLGYRRVNVKPEPNGPSNADDGAHLGLRLSF